MPGQQEACLSSGHEHEHYLAATGLDRLALALLTDVSRLGAQDVGSGVPRPATGLLGAGLAAARARGRRGGRPSVMSAHKLQVAQEMYASGQYTVAAIATRPLA
jgi:hypothetical protein